MRKAPFYSASLRNKLLLAGFVSVGFLCDPHLQAANGVWDNASGGAWNINTNWVGNTIANGSDFTASLKPTPGAASNIAITLGQDRTIGGISYTGSTTTGSYSISGDTLTLGGSATVQVASSLGGGLTINSIITGTSGLTKTSGGNLVLTGENSYSGTTSIAAGMIVAGNSSALGSGSVTVASPTSNSRLGLQGGIDLGNSLTVGSQAQASADHVFLYNLGGDNIYSGTIAVSSAAPTISRIQSTAGSLDIQGNVSVDSTQALYFQGDGDTTVTGDISSAGAAVGRGSAGTGTTYFAGAKSYTAKTVIGGNLSIDTIANGNVASGLGASSNAAANLEFQNNGVLAYTGTTASTDRNFTINTGVTAAIAVSEAATVLTMSGGSAATNGNLEKRGDGTLALTGDNLHTGSTRVVAGTLLVNGSVDSAAGVTVDEGATLGGSGSIAGDTIVNGNVNPGTSPGVLTFENSLTLSSTSEVTMEINGAGTARGTDYDGVNVGGILTYDGDLTLTMSGTIANDTYQLFDFSSIALGSNFDAVGFAGGFYEGTFSYADGFWTAVDSNGSDQMFSFEVATGNLVVAAVPEPSTTLLMLGGLFVAGILLRRKRRLEGARV